MNTEHVKIWVKMYFKRAILTQTSLFVSSKLFGMASTIFYAWHHHVGGTCIWKVPLSLLLMLVKNSGRYNTFVKNISENSQKTKTFEISSPSTTVETLYGYVKCSLDDSTIPLYILNETHTIFQSFHFYKLPKHFFQ